jgi:hypothetical protein
MFIHNLSHLVSLVVKLLISRYRKKPKTAASIEHTIDMPILGAVMPVANPIITPNMEISNARMVKTVVMILKGREGIYSLG